MDVSDQELAAALTADHLLKEKGLKDLAALLEQGTIELQLPNRAQRRRLHQRPARQPLRSPEAARRRKVRRRISRSSAARNRA